jgi:spermidine synthase
MKSDPRSRAVAALLFCSGLCALIYQTTWLREFRLIFGASTASSAAVLGIFMGGLGLGSAWLGRRSEAAVRPLAFYGKLELWIALSAAATPALVALVRMLYQTTGGSMVLGPTAGTLVRLALAALVLIVPTVLMGGTLPGAVRAVASEEDSGRRSLAFLYGANTLGAVTGAALSTFFLVELLGNRGTLWLACAINAIVALIALRLARRWPEVAKAPAEETSSIEARAPWRLVLVSAAVVGGAFMLLELVWYRLLSPILGGSTFTFGLILVVALAGIGLGGASYALLRGERPATLGGFAFTCGLEAAVVALPYALGDRVALLALYLRPLAGFGFYGQVLGWILVTALVVLPAALVAGYQFPMLIALLGRGRAAVGRQTGLAYAANTGGAIVGSLLGGFWLLPRLTAPGAWQAVVIVLAALALVAAFVAARRGERAPLCAGLFAALSLALLTATGPTSAWRHSGIGAGRASLPDPTINLAQDFERLYRRVTVWEAEGLESGVALFGDAGYSFIINGKADGNTRGDAGTQVMGGLVGALLHPAPKRALVIGLGTGCTAGWLAQVPGMERVDVVELEPAIVAVARACAGVNERVLENPKVHLHFGDAREVLLATRERYDIIFSEPSNPYRAGIASLFTREFYAAARERLAPGGIFLQWLQAYDIDGEAMDTVYATLADSFPAVTTWQTATSDLLLCATREPLAIDAEQLRARVASEPFARALMAAWRVDSAEGVLSHFVANEELARFIARSDAPVSTDDRNHLEFGFARGVGRGNYEKLDAQVIACARTRGWQRPALLSGAVDWDSVEAQVPTIGALSDIPARSFAGESDIRAQHREFLRRICGGADEEAARYWKEHALHAVNVWELEALAFAQAAAGAPEADETISQIAAVRPAEAALAKARQQAIQGRWADAVTSLEATFAVWQTDAWPRNRFINRAIDLARVVGGGCGDTKLVCRLEAALAGPSPTPLARDRQLEARLVLAGLVEPAQREAACLVALEAYGPHYPWRRDLLEQRVRVFLHLKDARVTEAAEELAQYRSFEAVRFASGLDAPAPAASAPVAAR